MAQNAQQRRKLAQGDAERSFVAGIHEATRPDRSTYEKEIATYWITFVIAWIFSLGSVIPACYTLFWFVYFLYDSFVWAVIVAVVFCSIIELFKHMSSHQVYRAWFFENQYIPKAWCAMLIGVFLLSIASSIFGAVQGNQDIAEGQRPPEITTDSTTLALQAEIDEVQAQNRRLEANKNSEGIIYFPTQQAITKNNELLVQLRQRLTGREEKLASDNDREEQQYEMDTRKTSLIFILLVCLMEIGFEICQRYLWGFKRRVYIERKENEGIDTLEDLQNEGASTRTASTPVGVHTEPVEKRLSQLEGTLGEISQLLKQQSAFRVHGENSQHNDPPNVPQEKVTAQRQERNLIGFKTGFHYSREDVYTIEHQYRKNGKTVTVHYTLPIIRGRVAQYERKLAVTGEMDENMLENISGRYHYWCEKETQLTAKLKRFGVLEEVLQHEREASQKIENNNKLI